MDSVFYKKTLSEIMDSIVKTVQQQVQAKKQWLDILIHDILAENIFGDSVRLNQVILNPMLNAIIFLRRLHPSAGNSKLYFGLWMSTGRTKSTIC